MEEMNRPFAPAPRPGYATGKRELVLAALTLLFSLAICNFLLYGGLNLGFAIGAVGLTGCAAIYLFSHRLRPSPYAVTLLVFTLVIFAGFARSDDTLVKFILLLFVAAGSSLALCLTAGQALRSSAGLGSVLDGFRGLFIMGFAGIGPAMAGLFSALRSDSPAAKKTGAVLLGLGISLPVLAVVISLLISADAAFSGLVELLPEFNIPELFITVFFGAPLGIFLYSRAAALKHRPKFNGEVTEVTVSVNSLTVNTVLMGVCVVFSVYLFSQLAYFGGGFAGILPEKYTMAEYARRGFFEMAWLCAIDLGLIALAAALVRRKENKMPLLTRLLCLFIALMTLFFVVSASAKMFMYIGSYGLTRLRVLTEVVMIFLGLATATVALWLFIPKLPYFKIVLLLALVMGTAVLWADVDTVVANYNVTAYQQGSLETVDVSYLATLGDGAKPHIARLLSDSDPAIARAAEKALTRFPPAFSESKDFRDWNYVNHIADKLFSDDA